MKNSLYLLLVFIVVSCNGKIKKDSSTVKIEKGTEIDETKIEKQQPLKKQRDNKSITGFWVGYFEKDDNSENIYVDEGFYWNRENKINISIDEVNDSVIIGHSVVAGNNRPFKGFYDTKKQQYIVKEPGDDKYDGVFNFEIVDGKLIGKWKAYKDINIKNRKYSLEKKKYVYNKNQLLDKSQRYIDWNKFTSTKEIEIFDDDETEEWVKKEFSSATNKIYEVNASNKLLTKKDVENLKKGDLTIIRNTIYARHSYSFKHRPLRVFFDAQPWYIPVHNDIRANFTKIELKNIRLLLSYEKNADEYYDYFGRG